MDVKRSSRLPKSAVISLLSFVMILPIGAHCQGTPSDDEGGTARIKGNVKFLPIPYVNYNRSFGYQLGAVPMIMFNPVKKDTFSPSSMAGMAALYSENKTWFYAGFSILYLDEDNWRIIVAGARGSVNFQFFLDNPIESWIPYNTEMDIILAQVQRRIVRDIYTGIGLIHLNRETTTDVLPIKSAAESNGLGLHVSMDRRSNVRYPKSGLEATAKYLTYPEILGNDTASSKIELDFNHYSSMRENNDVLANRMFVGLGLGDLAFDQQFIVGMKDIRGYTQGAFRGDILLAAQSEYRWNFLKRWSVVGFVGVATVFEAINENDNGKLLYGIGTGFRYMVDTETNLNVGTDIAAGIDDWGVYFRIGEAF